MGYGDIIGNLIKTMANQGQSKLEYLINGFSVSWGINKSNQKIFLSEQQDKILGKVGAGGITAEEQKFICEELNQPSDMERLLADVPNVVIGAQVYAASLFAIILDTEAEKTI